MCVHMVKGGFVCISPPILKKNWQAWIQELMLEGGSCFGEGSGERLCPKRVQGSAGGGGGGNALEAPGNRDLRSLYKCKYRLF